MSQVTIRVKSGPEFEIPDLMTIAELIDTACGDIKKNTVNFKLLEAVLVILARQLKMLQRSVHMKLPKNVAYSPSDSKLSVTEVKIHAKIKKKLHLPFAQRKSSTRIGTTSTYISPKKCPSLSAFLKPNSSTEKGQPPNSAVISSKLLIIKSTSERTSKSKSHKKGIIKRLLAMSEISEDEAGTKNKKQSTDITSTDISSTDKTTDESAIIPILGKKSFLPYKTRPGISSSDETRSEEPTSSSTEQICHFAQRREVSIETTEIIEDQYEELLFVERVPSEEAKARVGRLQGETRAGIPRLSIVTEEEFMDLIADVRKLQAKFDAAGTTDFPEDLLKALHKDASWSDGMAALQISTRLEASEKALERMISLVTDLAGRYPNADTTSLTQVYSDTVSDAKMIYHGPPPSSVTHVGSESQISVTSQESVKTVESVQDTSSTLTTSKKDVSSHIAVIEEDLITTQELKTALEEVCDSVISPLTQTIDKCVGDASLALQNAYKLDTKVNAALTVDKQMAQLEAVVAKYAEKVNAIDAALSSKMIRYQDEINNMQYALQSTIDHVFETFATNTGEVQGIAELNSCFNRLETEFIDTYMIQSELKEAHSVLQMDMEKLRNQIETVREIKSDREELAKALEDKVGFETLNSIVSLEIFYAVRGDIESKISLAFNKFDNQEHVWQKAIDDLVRSLEEKANQTQVISLKNDIMYHINRLKERVTTMHQTVGKHQLTTFTRKMHRDNKCFSCSTPAYVKETVVPKLPLLKKPKLRYLTDLRPPTVEVESVQKNKEVHRVCFPGLPILHSRHTRAHFCQRYCSGPSFKLPITVSRIPPDTILKTIGRDFPDTRTADKAIKKPCIPCIIKQNAIKDKTPNISTVNLSDNVAKDGNPSMISTDFRRRS